MPPSLASWQRAALLKDRTRRAIRDRIRSGESAKSIADDFQVPIRFVKFLGPWQLFEDRGRKGKAAKVIRCD